MSVQPRIVEVRKNILKQNDVIAAGLRRRFQNDGIFAMSLVSSPGSGKTLFLEKVLSMLRPRYRVAALVGDLATENDATRLARSGAPVKQITTGTLCRLEAAMVEQALSGWDVSPLDFLFIENVGNLVCPSSYDLGENLRAVFMSVTEGEDKPLKYPTIFNGSDIVVITKVDLSDAAQFDSALLERNLKLACPERPIFYVSAKTGNGMEQGAKYLEAQIKELRAEKHTEIAKVSATTETVG